MLKRFLCLAIFIRHGETGYTDIYPDLTGQGVKTIRESAEKIRPLITKCYQDIVLITSPTTRAQGSADIIARALGYKGKIKLEPTIQAAIIKNPQKAEKLLHEYITNGGTRALSVAYGTAIHYQDGKVIEPRSEVRERFFKYLAKLVRQMYISTKLPLCLIHVSHYEVIYHLVEFLFNLDYQKDEPLGYGEIVAISIYDIGSENIVEIEVTFRGETKSKIFFDYIVKEIR